MIYTRRTLPCSRQNILIITYIPPWKSLWTGKFGSYTAGLENFRCTAEPCNSEFSGRAVSTSQLKLMIGLTLVSVELMVTLPREKGAN